jgi:hypothetical protein
MSLPFTRYVLPPDLLIGEPVPIFPEAWLPEES